MVTLNAARGILSIPENRRDVRVSRPAFEPVVLKGSVPSHSDDTC